MATIRNGHLHGLFSGRRTLRAVTTGALLLLAAPACDKGGGESKDGDEGAEKSEAKGEAEKAVEDAEKTMKVKFSDVKGMVRKGKPIDAEQYEKLILAHEGCEVTQKGGIDSKCEAVKIMRDSMNRSQLAKGALGGNAKLGQKLIGHESPAVRIKAAKLMGSMLGTAKKSQNLIVEAAKKEEHPAVLKAMIRTVRNDGEKNPAVGKLLLEFAEHEEPMIRKEAIYALSSSWNDELEGGPETLIEMMKNDEDMEVRKTACKYAGELGDEKLFPIYRELLEDRDEGELWAKCFQGLVSMWADYPLYETYSEDAYDLTMKLLESKPRTEHIPPWQVMGTLGYLGGDNKSLKEWKEKVDWYEPAKLKKALADVVGDGDAKWMARTGAVKALAKLGATKAELQKLRKPLGEEPEGDDRHVAKSLDKAVSKM